VNWEMGEMDPYLPFHTRLTRSQILLRPNNRCRRRGGLRRQSWRGQTKKEGRRKKKKKKEKENLHGGEHDYEENLETSICGQPSATLAHVVALASLSR
jgi:hypothetical protein